MTTKAKKIASNVLVGIIITISVVLLSWIAFIRYPHDSATITDKKLSTSFKGLTPHAIYPQISHIGDKSIENEINNTIYSEATKLLNKDYGAGNWQKLYQDFLDNPNIPADQKKNFKSEVSLSYNIKANQHRMLSLQLTFTEMIGGMAHPYEYSENLTFDLKSGKMLSLKDLFISDEAFTQAFDIINTEIKTQISQKTDKEVYIFDSIAPNQSFFLTPTNNIVIYFNSGEIAPNSLGPVEFKITQDKLSSLLKTSIYKAAE